MEDTKQHGVWDATNGGVKSSALFKDERQQRNTQFFGNFDSACESVWDESNSMKSALRNVIKDDQHHHDERQQRMTQFFGNFDSACESAWEESDSVNSALGNVIKDDRHRDDERQQFFGNFDSACESTRDETDGGVKSALKQIFNVHGHHHHEWQQKNTQFLGKFDSAYESTGNYAYNSEIEVSLSFLANLLACINWGCFSSKAI